MIWLFFCWTQIHFNKENLQTNLASAELFNHANKSKFILVEPSIWDHNSSDFNILSLPILHYSYSISTCGCHNQHQQMLLSQIKRNILSKFLLKTLRFLSIFVLLPLAYETAKH